MVPFSVKYRACSWASHAHAKRRQVQVESVRNRKMSRAQMSISSTQTELRGQRKKLCALKVELSTRNNALSTLLLPVLAQFTLYGLSKLD